MYKNIRLEDVEREIKRRNESVNEGKKVCPECNGSGQDEANPKEECVACGGSGKYSDYKLLGEGKVAVGAKTCPKCGDDLTDTGNRDDKGVTCGGCGKSFKVEMNEDVGYANESVNEMSRKSSYPETANTIGEKLRKARLDAKMDLNTLAAKAGIAPGYLSRVENDKQIASPKVIQDIQKALSSGVEEPSAQYYSESINEARVNLIYNMDLDALNDIYMEQGGQTDIEAALDAFEPLAMKLARQTIEGELYYFGAQNAAVVSVEPRLDSGKYMSDSKYLDVIVDVPDMNSLTQLDAKGSPFQVSGGDKMAESLFMKFGIIEKKEPEPEVEDDTDEKKLVNTIYKEALRGLDGKEATRDDIQSELEQVSKYVDAASPVKHIVYMRLLKKFRRAKPVEETNDSDRVKMGYEQSLEETLKDLSNKYIL